MYYTIEGKKFLCILYITGLFCGSLLLNLLLRTEYVHYTDFLGFYDYISSLDTAQLGHFFSYVLVIRMRQMLLFFLAICLFSPYVIFCILDFLVSLITGCFISILVLHAGWLGMAQGILFYFPHAVFYGAFFYILYAYLFQKSSIIPTYYSMHRYPAYRSGFRKGVEYRILVVTGCVLMFLLGCYTESYWSPRMVKYFIHLI